MRRIILIIILMVGTACLYLPLKHHVVSDADNYIIEDSIWNRNLAVQTIDNLFSESKYDRIVSILYHHFQPNFELLSSEQKSKIDKKNQLYQVYMFAPDQMLAIENPLKSLCVNIRAENYNRGTDIDAPLNGGFFYGIWQSCWALGCSKRISDDKYICYIIIPFMVGYRQQKESFLYERPTIQEALNVAFNFYTNNEKSEYKNFILTENLNRFSSLVLANLSLPSYDDTQNTFFIEEIANKKSDFELAEPDIYNGRSYMFNDFIVVHLAVRFSTTYKLKYNRELALRKKDNYILEHEQNLQRIIIIVEFVLCIILIIMMIAYSSSKRNAKKTILEKLIEASNPKRFMKPYNQEFVEIANRLYDKARNTNMEDKETIENLCKEAEDKLGIVLVDKSDLKKLTERCNPKHFMHPYNAENIAKANILYARLKSNKINYAEYIEIKNDIDSLYQ